MPNLPGTLTLDPLNMEMMGVLPLMPVSSAQSMTRLVPLIAAAAGLARKTIAFATSSAVVTCGNA